MKVSIIIPSYNYGEFLAETLDNLLDQKYFNWEALIIDDGSTDNTKELVEKYLKKDSRFRYFFQPNAGLSNARNTGLLHARGEFLQFLDADDLLSKDKIDLQVKYMEDNPTVDLVYSDCWYFQSENPSILFPDLEMQGVEWMPKVDGKGFTILNNLIKRNFTVVSSPLLRRTSSNQHIKFSENVSNSEDWYYWLELAMANTHFAYLPDQKASTLIRVHKKSMSQNAQKMYYGELKLRKWLEQKIKSLPIDYNLINKLSALNEHLTDILIKHVILTGPLWDLKHLYKMTQFSSFYEVFQLHKIARNHQHK
ncbi:glycosyltransferase involved in cell wall biosynthesis [Algoriphagus ratkowskyi]|uniref:Glycosyltransferase family 2 protein n=1 Tax=Algoriphagus ratkowskyi TaxID=57028 RepID=A0A2W7RD48_9BACT|nr:glycosyltransferase family 2 protein [Algoriphagus ratkowskyi]PZX57056.1 glycosyltransferase involved in cell wall biosynthesis [Algoriphagus ratkowskyi]TXD79953.1 glycosyltransferase family 2 protein [Algoriphagus ratkowskyi]